MPTLISEPTRIRSAGNKPKLIDEYIGRVNSNTAAVSVAHMRSPEGWEEPGQTPEFEEFTIVLKGTLRVRYKGGSMDVTAGQALVAHAEEWVQYSTPLEGGPSILQSVYPPLRWKLSIGISRRYSISPVIWSEIESLA